MSRILSSLVVASFALVLASCDDDPEAQPISPTEPVVVAPVSPAVTLGDAPVKVKGSSVCASYDRERTKLLDQLSKAPDDAALLKRAKSLAAVITDACN